MYHNQYITGIKIHPSLKTHKTRLDAVGHKLQAEGVSAHHARELRPEQQHQHRTQHADLEDEGEQGTADRHAGGYRQGGTPCSQHDAEDQEEQVGVGWGVRAGALHCGHHHHRSFYTLIL